MLTRSMSFLASLLILTTLGGLNAQAATWNINGDGNAGGNWNTAANWDPNGIPNAPGADVAFTKSIDGNRTITLSADVTIGSLTAGDPTGPPYHRFHINSSNTTTRTLTFDADDGDDNTLDIATINRSTNSGGRVEIGHSTNRVNLQLNSPLLITWVSNAGDLRLLGTISGSNGITVRSGGDQGDQVSFYDTLNYSGDTTLEGGYVGVWGAAKLPFGAGKGNINVNNNGTEVSKLAFWAAGTHDINGLNGDGVVEHAGDDGNLLTLQVGNGNANGDFSGVIQLRAVDPGNRRMSFAKTGTGTQVLSGDNLYNGTTTVSGGTLLVNGTHASANPENPDATPGAYTVLPTGSGHAILGGTGTISSTVNVSGVDATSRGTIAPGASAGTFTIGGLTLGDYASFAFELDPSLAGPAFIGGGDNDLLDVTGNVDLSGADASTIELNVQDVGGGDFAGLGTWYLVKFDTSDFTPGSFDLADVGITGLATGYSATLGLITEGGSDYLAITVVPEPNAIILAGFGLLGLRFVLKRKQK